MGINSSKELSKEELIDSVIIEDSDLSDIISIKLDKDYSYCIFCEKHTIIKNHIHCNFCDECHLYNIYDCQKSKLYYETRELEKKYRNDIQY